MPKNVAISNTTPIIALSRISHLQILKFLYGNIIIPQAVFDELISKNDSVSSDVFNNSGWIDVRKICLSGRFKFDRNTWLIIESKEEWIIVKNKTAA